MRAKEMAERSIIRTPKTVKPSLRLKKKKKEEKPLLRLHPLGFAKAAHRKDVKALRRILSHSKVPPASSNSAYALLEHLSETEDAVLSAGTLDLLEDAFRYMGLLDMKDAVKYPPSFSSFGGASGVQYITWAEYLLLMGALRQPLDLLTGTGKVGFAIYTNRDLGGWGAGPWTCKSHFFTFLLMRRKGVVPRDAPLFLVKETDDADAVEAAFENEFPDTGAPSFLVHFLDGIYSGKEAENIASGLSSRVPSKTKVVIMTPALYRLPRSSALWSLSVDGAKPLWKLPADHELCRPIANTIQVWTSKRYENNFVLPFKIADDSSLGRLSTQLHELNPHFRPPYRRHPMCDDKRPLTERIRHQNLVASAKAKLHATHGHKRLAL
jgi:hypothetical protein